MKPLPIAGCLLSLLIIEIGVGNAQSPFSAGQNVQGDFIAPPRSNVVLQSVVMHPHHGRPFFGRPFEGDDCEGPDLREFRRFFRFLRRSPPPPFPFPLPYKKTPLDEKDSEVVDPDTLDKIISAVKSLRKHKKPSTQPEMTEDPAVMENEQEKERSKRHNRHLWKRRRSDYDVMPAKIKHEADNENSWRAIRKPEETTEDELMRKWFPHRRFHKKDWNDLFPVEAKRDDEKTKKLFEDEWKDVWSKNPDAKDTYYLPTNYPLNKHYLKPRSIIDYVK